MNDVRARFIERKQHRTGLPDEVFIAGMALVEVPGVHIFGLPAFTPCPWQVTLPLDTLRNRLAWIADKN